jgi:hypothetical protein
MHPRGSCGAQEPPLGAHRSSSELQLLSEFSFHLLKYSRRCVCGTQHISALDPLLLGLQLCQCLQLRLVWISAELIDDAGPRSWIQRFIAAPRVTCRPHWRWGLVRMSILERPSCIRIWKVVLRNVAPCLWKVFAVSLDRRRFCGGRRPLTKFRVELNGDVFWLTGRFMISSRLSLGEGILARNTASPSSASVWNILSWMN